MIYLYPEDQPEPPLLSRTLIYPTVAPGLLDVVTLTDLMTRKYHRYTGFHFYAVTMFDALQKIFQGHSEEAAPLLPVDVADTDAIIAAFRDAQEAGNAAIQD